jgi:hypothetical protein
MRTVALVTMAGNYILQQRLDAYVAGECSSHALAEELLAHCAAMPRASWEALALLDQYQRRGKLPRDLQRSISQSIQRRALGIHGSEPASALRQVDLTQLEAANQNCIRNAAWQWPARSAQWMAVVVFMLALGASQRLDEHGNLAPLRMAQSPRIAVPGRLTLAADTLIVQPGGRSASISVARLDGTDGAVSFRWWTQAAGAKAGADYRGRTATRVSIPPGTDAVQLTVPILANPARRHTELFYVAIGDPGGGARLGEIQRAAVFLLPR